MDMQAYLKILDAVNKVEDSRAFLKSLNQSDDFQVNFDILRKGNTMINSLHLKSSNEILLVKTMIIALIQMQMDEIAKIPPF